MPNKVSTGPLRRADKEPLDKEGKNWQQEEEDSGAKTSFLTFPTASAERWTSMLVYNYIYFQT